MQLSPEMVTMSQEDQLQFPVLEAVSIQDIQLRFVVLRSFNRRVSGLLPLIDLSCADDQSFLAQLLRRVRRFIFSHTKAVLFSKVRVGGVDARRSRSCRARVCLCAYGGGAA